MPTKCLLPHTTSKVKTNSCKDIITCECLISRSLIQKGPSPIFDMINSKPVKRKLSRAIPAETASKKQQRLSRLVSSGNCSKERQPEPCTVNSEVKFDMAGLMQRNHLLFSDDLASSSESTTTDRVIGWCDLKEHGRRVCLVVHNSSIACFNTSR